MTRAHVDRAGLPVCGCGHQTRLASEQHRQKSSRREQRVVSIKAKPRRSGKTATEVFVQAERAAAAKVRSARPKIQSSVLPAGRTKGEAARIEQGLPPFKSAIWFGPQHGYGIKRAKTINLGPTAPTTIRESGQVADYLGATGKAAVPAHDPAFGRRAA
jgi:hypothetical protein